jgi:PhnB protein
VTVKLDVTPLLTRGLLHWIEEKIMIGVQPYIAFRGNAREAIDFYKQALGAEELYAQTYGDSPMPDMGNSDAIMHATVKIGDSHIMICDDFHSEDFSLGGNVSLAIGMNDVEKAKTYFANLSDGGNVTMPLDKTFWAEAFGMLTDKFGVKWMINCDAPQTETESAAA